MCETAAKLEATRRDISLKERIKYLIEQNPALTEDQKAILGLMGNGYLSLASEAIQELLPGVPETREASEADYVNRPSHYAKWNLEPTKWAREFGVDWNIANAVKYIFRFADKLKPREDLRKAIRYLEMEWKWRCGDPEWSK